MKKIVFLICLFFFPIYLNAYSYTVMDADSGRVLASSNMNEKHLIASTTKIMTAIVAIENGNLNDTYTASKIIEEVYGSMIYAKEGEKYSLEDLLYGLMLRSGNDAAMIIAENTLGINKFINKMNSLSTTIGMKNTIFENTHGLDDETKNYSTAYDLALLMKYAMKNETFRKITSTKKYIVKTNFETHEWFNKNKLLSTYKYATGGKIGYTDKSGHVFVSSSSKNKKNLIVATIEDPDRFNTHKNLYEIYFDKYERYQILNKYTFSFDDEKFKNYHIYIKNDFYMLLKKDEIKKLSMDIVLKDKIKDSTLGYVNIKLGNDIIHKETLYAVNKNNRINKIKDLLWFWK